MMCKKVYKKVFLVCLALVSVMSAAISCISPDSSEYFVPIERVDSLGRLGFEIDMSDSSKTFDISVFTRVDSPETIFASQTEFLLGVDWESPMGQEFTEQVYLPLNEFAGPDSFVHDLCAEYRTGIIPDGYGIWKVYITPPQISGLRGVGLIITRNDR